MNAPVLKNLVNDPDLIEKPFEKFSVSDLVKQYPNDDEPLIDGLLRIGETMNLIAAPKMGKSWLVAGLAYAVANGTPWMGRDTNQGKVLVFDCELKPANLRFRYTTVGESLSLPSEGIDLISLRGDLRSLTDIAVDIERTIEPGEYSCIIWDALYRLLPDGTSENDNTAMASVYNSLDAIAKHTGSANVVVHHTSKGSQSVRGVTDIGSGAGAISRAADTHLTLRAHELTGCAVLDAVCRSFPSPAPKTIRWDFPVWNETWIEPELAGIKDRPEKKQNRTDEETKSKILETLDIKRWTSSGQIREKTGFGYQRVARGLSLLKGEVESASKRNKKTGQVREMYRRKRGDAVPLGASPWSA